MESEKKICTTAELVEFITSHIMEGYEPGTFGNLMAKQVCDRLNALEAERDRLREALNDIAYMHLTNDGTNGEVMKACIDRATQALKGGGDE